MSEFIRTEERENCLLCDNIGKPLFVGLSDRLYRVPGQWNYLYCKDCGLAWLSPRPVSEDLGKCYPDSYFTHEKPDFADPLSLDTKDKLTAFKRRLRLAILRGWFNYQHLPKQSYFLSPTATLLMLLPSFREKVTMGLGQRMVSYKEKGRLLDIGCGNGTYLALMKRLGWEVAGIEIDPEAAKIASSNFGIYVHVGDIATAPFDSESFDVITMSHVIEHVPDPVRFLGEAIQLLKPSGKVIIVTPNLQSLGARFFGTDWYYWDPPRHLVLFTPRSLALCLKKAGLSRQHIYSSPRKARKIFRKRLLLQKTGFFSHEYEDSLTNHLWAKFGAKLFEILERLGNFVFYWGEEIECVAVKE
jgi:2-polyprenyl-3-methyl-5-hydroxy-6-metoxy-1,4-benzoquinol methylase